ncbi:MAG: Zn-dependent hydrolase [Rhodospirillales bacterium]
MTSSTVLPVRAERLLADLRHIRRIGAVGSGVSRGAFTDADIAARQWLAQQMRAAGLEPRVDPAGNLFALPPGEAPSLLIGSHSDTQPLGGWLDGIYGVMVGLEVARAALEAGPGAPRVAAVSFQDEEGRFGGLTGSRVWAGGLSLAEADGLSDAEGMGFAEARARAAEIAPLGEVPHSLFKGYLEAHIEQGIVLDRNDQQIGVVTDIVGMRTLQVTFRGEPNHAGTTPMALRCDAVRAAARFAQGLDADFAPLLGADTVWTIGAFTVSPNAPSIIPETAVLSLQMRDVEDGRLERLAEAATRRAEASAEAERCEVALEVAVVLQATKMDPALVEVCAQAAARRLPAEAWRRMPSGALHDASSVARVLPCGMIFVPSIAGISHSPKEDTADADLATGLAVVAEAVGLIG